MKALIIITVIALLLCSCSFSNAKDTAMSSSITINDDTKTFGTTDISKTEDFAFNYEPISEVDFVEYNIDCFLKYFGPYSSVAENQWAGFLSSKDQYSYKTVMDMFPGGCLRQYGENNPLWYTMFKIKEGGFFYVVWGDELHCAMAEPSEIYACELLYVTQLNSKSMFDSLKIGISTAEDVTSIDAAAEFNFSMSGGVVSWHLLDDGSVLEIVYSIKEDYYVTHARSNLYIECMEIVDPEKTGCLLKKINPQDIASSTGDGSVS